ncbi:DUF4276 family protein [Lysobacter hankyongensis]|uniref:DUF4276 family protein n=1 Tax=Lysobacter hankyongensis TaxID=1176535 RepID=A0ABP9C8Z6_9GAMM
MRELVFLLEEMSARALLESLLPRVLSDQVAHRLIPFEGKQDLERQLARKIRGYRNPHARFIILRDQDSHPDCRALKQNLLDLCASTGRQDQCLVRIACTELETFYLADLQAVETALEVNGLAARQQSRKFRAPDTLASPSQELKTLTGNRYQKVSGSRAIGLHIAANNDRSPSFRNLMAAIRKMETALLALPE